MGTYSLEHVILEWRKGNLTADHVIGQILLMTLEIHTRLAQIESRLVHLEHLPKATNSPSAVK